MGLSFFYHWDLVFTHSLGSGKTIFIPWKLGKVQGEIAIPHIVVNSSKNLENIKIPFEQYLELSKTESSAVSPGGQFWEKKVRKRIFVCSWFHKFICIIYQTGMETGPMGQGMTWKPQRFVSLFPRCLQWHSMAIWMAISPIFAHA